VGGYLKALRRTKIGNHSVDNAIGIDEMVKLIEGNKTEKSTTE